MLYHQTGAWDSAKRVKLYQKIKHPIWSRKQTIPHPWLAVYMLNETEY